MKTSIEKLFLIALGAAIITVLLVIVLVILLTLIPEPDQELMQTAAKTGLITFFAFWISGSVADISERVYSKLNDESYEPQERKLYVMLGVFGPFVLIFSFFIVNPLVLLIKKSKFWQWLKITKTNIKKYFGEKL